MKILILAESLVPQSGWGTYSRNTVIGLTRREHTVTALVKNVSSESSCTQIASLPNPLAMLDSPFARFLAAWQIRMAVWRYKPDVIHVFVEPYALALPLVRFIGDMPPWIMNMHGTYSALPVAEPKTRSLMVRAYRQASRLIVCSDYTLGQVMDALSIFAPHDVEAIREKTKRFRFGILPPTSAARKTEPHDVKQVLFVGGVKARKGVLELVKGFHAFLQSAKVPAILTIIGDARDDDRYVRELKQYVRRHSLEQAVLIRGHVSEEEREKAYAEADAFAMLSKREGIHFEGFGLVFLEANARGIPTIGSTDSGCQEAIQEGVSGYAVDATDADAIAKRMEWILVEQRIKGEDCVRWAAEHSIDQQTDSVEAAYEAAMNA